MAIVSNIEEREGLQQEVFEDLFLPSLSDEDKKEIAAAVVLEAEEYEKARTDFLEKVKEGIRLYHGVREPKNEPWENCANYSTMHTAAVVDLLHARLYPLAWNPNSIGWRPKNKSAVHNLEKVSKFMKVISESEQIYNSRYGLDEAVDDLTKIAITEGTVCMKIYWNVEEKEVLKQVQTDIDELGNPVFELQPVKEEFRRPRLEFIPLEDCLFPPDAEDEQTCRSVIHRTYYTLEELENLEGIENLEELKKLVEKDVLAREGIKKERMDALGLAQLSSKVKMERIEVLERYGKWEIDDEYVECVFLIARKHQVYLSGYKLSLISPTGTRPFIIRPFLKRQTGLYGISIPMLISHLQKLIDAIHNQRIDMGNIAIAPPVFYRPASGYDPEAHTWGPLMAVPLDDPRRDVFIPTIPVQGLQYSFQEEQVVLSLIERLTSVGSYQLGLESEIVKSRATASGTLALIEQGQQKFNMLARRIVRIIADLLTRLKQLYEENLTPDEARRIIGQGYEDLFPQGLEPRDILGQHEAVVTINEEAANKTFQKQAAIAKYQMFVNDPFVNLDPRRMWQLRYEMLKALGEEKPERFIGPEPKGLPSVNYDAEEEFDAMLAGKMVKPSEFENAMEHLITHLSQMDTEAYKNMPPQYKENFNKHLQMTYQLVWMQLQRQYQMASQKQEAIYGAENTGARNQGSQSPPGVQGNTPPIGGGQGAGTQNITGSPQGGQGWAV